MRQRKARIEDLEDDHLLIIFSKLDPLPDLFRIAQCCKRFHKIASGGELFLRVGYPPQKIAGKRELEYSTLQSALCNSRKGDTVVISPGRNHSVESLITRHPLRILGGGKIPEETTLVCTSNLCPGLSFRASGEVLNLSMSGGKSPCLEQCKGKLKVDRCILMGQPERGLEHLSSPIKFNPFGPAFQSGVQKTGLVKILGNVPGEKPESGACLSVSETVIRGQSGMKAVDTSMSQSAIKDVRIVEFARDTLYWFKVSASHRGQVKKLPRNLSSSVLYPDQEENLPAWVRSQEQLFPNFTDNLERDKSEFTRLRELDDSMEDLQYKAKSWTSRGAFDLA